MNKIDILNEIKILNDEINNLSKDKSIIQFQLDELNKMSCEKELKRIELTKYLKFTIAL